MNRYIVQYTIGDECTYSCEVTAPIVSPENLENTKDTICLTIMDLFERLRDSGASEYLNKPSIHFINQHGLVLDTNHAKSFKKMGIPSNMRGDDWLEAQLVIYGHNFHELCCNIGFNRLMGGTSLIDYQFDVYTLDQWFDKNIVNNN